MIRAVFRAGVFSWGMEELTERKFRHISGPAKPSDNQLRGHYDKPARALQDVLKPFGSTLMVVLGCTRKALGYER